MYQIFTLHTRTYTTVITVWKTEFDFLHVNQRELNIRGRSGKHSALITHLAMLKT